MKKRRFILLFIVMVLLIFPTAMLAVDYSQTENWLYLPGIVEKDVDVFYVYPTAWFKEDSAEPNICAIDNRIMRIGSQNAFDRQATAFETVGNIYAPYYAQGDASYILSLPEKKRWDFVKGTPAKDVTAAFDYYIKNYNDDQPFILLGHSQGAMALMCLLEDYMDENPAVYERMIGAYVIGYPVSADYMASNKHLHFAQGAEDTGVIISYNTQSPDVAAGGNILVTDTTSLVINPINWKRDETLALASENLGSYIPEDATFDSHYSKVEHFADARIDLSQGVLICGSVDAQEMYELSRGSFDLGVYHSFDIPFYYYNLRENAERRTQNFLSKQTGNKMEKSNTGESLADYISQKAPLITAHRGYAEIAPENTISAFEAAVNAGADACEFDVHMTKDGVLVVIHDDTVDRTTNGTGAIKELTYAYLSTLDAGSWKDPKFTGEKIPTLEQTLKYFKEHNMVAVLEIKVAHLVDEILEMLVDTRMDESTVIISFAEFAIAKIGKLNPEIPALLLIYDKTCMMGTTENKVKGISEKADAIGTKYVGPFSFQLENHKPERLLEAVNNLKNNIDPGELPLALDADTVEALHKRGYLIDAWTVDSEENIRDLIMSEVDFLTTNYLERAISIKKEVQGK